MFIRAKEECDIPTHLIPKGATVDIPDVYAEQLIAEGRAVKVETEKAIQDIEGRAEKRTQPGK